MRRLLPLLVMLVVVGCSASSGTTQGPAGGGSTEDSTAAAVTEVPVVPPEPSAVDNAAVSVEGDADTGASDSFTLAGGTYDVAWTTTADTAGCYFSLVLTTAVDGPSVKNGVKLLPEAKEYSGTFTWVAVFAGTYVLQEDRSGYGHCKGPWSATLTPR